MGWKGSLLSLFTARTARRVEQDGMEALQHQRNVFADLIRQGSKTSFGAEHRFSEIRTHRDFADRVPVRDYEDFQHSIHRIWEGEHDVLWPGRPIYMSKTSGTTSGVKYIPITKESIPYHIAGARDGLFNMVHQLRLNSIFDGKMIFLSGSPVLEEKEGLQVGRLSGIVNHWIPAWLKSNQLPSYHTNCIEDWEEKVAHIARETVKADMRLISGIPPWVQMYYEKLLELSGKSTIRSLFPNYSMFVYGGVQFEPYRKQLENLTGDAVASLETFPASEGFIAFQDQVENEKGLLLRTHHGIYYEFIPLEDRQKPDGWRRLSLEEVETGISYAMVLSTNAGLWAYDLGDTVEFVSTRPYRVRVTGRVKHFISAFGEHVIAKEVEEALRQTVDKFPCTITEFTVAPQVNPVSGEKPFHEWYIEFGRPPDDLGGFQNSLDQAMVQQNVYYRDLIDGKILQPLIVRRLPVGSFKRYMQSIGKLGGQNKVPRLSNDRRIADVLSGYLDPVS